MQQAKRQNVYEDTQALRKIIVGLKGRRFILDCGHKLSFGYFLSNDITVLAYLEAGSGKKGHIKEGGKRYASRVLETTR